MVDPREYELPDAGLLYVQDAETGEQLLVDSSDPELRRRLRALADEQDDDHPPRRSLRPGSTSTSCRPRTTSSRAFVRMAASGAGGIDDDLRLAGVAARLAGPPGRGGRLRAVAPTTRRRSARTSPRRASSRPASARRRAGAGTCRSRCSSLALGPPRRRRRPADGDHQDAAAPGHGDPRDRRLQQHGREPTSSPPASARRSWPPSDFVREQPSSVRIGVVAFGPSARDRAAAHLRPRRRPAGHQPPVPGRRHLAWRRASSPRSTPSPARR